MHMQDHKNIRQSKKLAYATLAVILLDGQGLTVVNVGLAGALPHIEIEPPKRGKEPEKNIIHDDQLIAYTTWSNQ